jgi:2-iminobutanoate/2-iminopropanoate deaminase
MDKTFVNPSSSLDSMPRGYTHAIVVRNPGSMIFVAGQGPVDGNMKLIGGSDIEAQTRATFQNIQRTLEASGASCKDIVKMIVFCTDIEAQQWPIRNVRGEFIDVAKPPVSTMIEVSKFAIKGMLLEIDVIAVLP